MLLIRGTSSTLVSDIIVPRLPYINLTNLVHNDFQASRGIFPIFDGLEVKDIEKPLHPSNVDLPTADDVTRTNGAHGTNGTNGTNGATKETRDEEKQNPGLMAAAKAAAVEVTNGIKGLAVPN
jgi:methylenetetrahydrofolate reductase (NADPH)